MDEFNRPAQAGEVVVFTSNNGNEFRKGDTAVLLKSGAFLGLSGDNMGNVFYESATYELVGDTKVAVERKMVEVRTAYLGGRS